jgi:hypothetical protein
LPISAANLDWYQNSGRRKQEKGGRKKRKRKRKKEKRTMEWNRTETLVLAAEKCVHCQGLGLREDRRSNPQPCKCVLRAVFRACYARFKQCANKDPYASRNSLEYGATRDAAGIWSRKNEEYVADFLLVSQKSLTEEEHKLFRYHYLLGADWRLCCRKLGVDKGNFFHAVYRIQQKLGRAYRELEPYPLYPLNDYFGSSMRNHNRAKVTSIQRNNGLSQMVPLKRAA